MRWAEHMEDETEHMLCLVRHFDNRHIRDARLWQESVFPEVSDFLSKYTQPGPRYHLLLDAHSSIAFAAGFCLNSKSRIDVAPVQSIRGKRVLWRPDETATAR